MRTRRQKWFQTLALGGVALGLSTLLAFDAPPPASGASTSRRTVASQPVGNLDGTFGVNGNGSATWELDVQVPPGTAGVAPSLSVTYDSHRGDGILGMGWALQGLSAISRCGASYQLDGYKAGVEFTDRDRFCLDGVRLIAVQGSYGADGTTYHTAQETWTQLVSHGRCGQGPCSFTATDKDGSQLSFGGTTGAEGSRILAQGRGDGAVRAWAIDRFTDLNQNDTRVAYWSDVTTGEYTPTRIDYTGNAKTGLAPQRKVELDYTSPRPDPLRTYLAGSQITVSRLLTSIRTSVGGAPVLRYNFHYEPSPGTGRSRMRWMEVCDATGVCLPRTTFDWTDLPRAFDPPTSQLPGPLYVALNNNLYVFGILLDVDGDGLADYSEATEFIATGQPREELKLYLGRTDGSFQQASWSLPGPVYRATSTEVVQTGLLEDINGDGLLDYSAALRNDDAGTSDLAVYLGTGSGFAKAPFDLPGPVYWQVGGRTLVTGVLEDLNADGIPDYSRATLQYATGEQLLDIWRGTGSGFENTGKKLPGPLYGIGNGTSLTIGTLRDINGDGIADFSAATDNNGQKDLKVHVGSTPDFAFQAAFDLPGPMFLLADGQSLDTGVLVDLNADGIPDYSRATRMEATGQDLLAVQLGTGTGYTAAAFNLPGPVYSIANGTSQIQGMIADGNRDGQADYSRATRWADGRADLELYFGASDGFEDAGYALPGPLFQVDTFGTFGHGIYQDVNGDGLADYAQSFCVMRADGSFTGCDLGVQLAATPFPDLLETVTNGFRGTVAIEYAPLTQGLYTRGQGSEYPIRDVQGAMYVVSRYTSADGRGDAYGFGYAYSGARVDVLGRGWLGFETLTLTEEASGRSSVTTFEQDAPAFGLTRTNENRGPDGELLSRTRYTYVDKASAAYQSLGIHQMLAESETFEQFTDDRLTYTLKNEYGYDGYGNPTLEASYGDVAQADDDLFTCTRYLPPSNGRIGYIEQQKWSSTRAGCDTFLAVTNPAQVTWNPATDLRWTKTGYDGAMNVASQAVWDDTHDAFLATAYEVDAYGNVTHVTNPAGDRNTIDYDPTWHTFPVRTASPPLQRGGGTYTVAVDSEYDPAFGTVLSTTGPNGEEMSQELDGFGRVVNVYGPDPAGAKALLVNTVWKSAGNSFYLETRQRPDWPAGDVAAWPWERSYVDGLAREYRTESTGLKNGQPATLVTEIRFDAEARVHQQSAPYYAGDPVPWTTTTYDVYNRPILSVDPGGVQEKLDYAQGGRQISRTFAYGTPDAQTEISTLDGQGLVVQELAPNGLTTTYGYDPIGQLRTVAITPQARSSSYGYDSVGRLRRAQTADTGVTTWDYDAQGYLRTVADAAGQTLRFTVYDALGRLVTRELSAGTGTATHHFTYDEPSVANGIGQLTRVTMEQAPLGTWEYVFGYDAYGETSAATVTLAGQTWGYTTETDPVGRTRTFTYPDGATQVLAYGADGNLSTISLGEAGAAAEPWVTYGDFTALGQFQTSELVRSGVRVSRTYNPVGPGYGLLDTLRAVATRQGDRTLFGQKTTWNQLSLVLGVTDLSDAAKSQSFSYDDQPANLHMGFLTGAQGPYGQRRYDYDPLGNLTQRDDAVLTYQPGTDRLQQSSTGAVYAFYDNGAMKSRSEGGVSWGYQYDAGGNLIQVDRTEGGATATGSTAYDYLGRRVFQQPVGETARIYNITDNFEVVDFGDGRFQHTKYLDGYNGRVAAVTTDGSGHQAAVASQAHRAAARIHGGSGVSFRGRLLGLLHAGLAVATHPETPGWLMAALAAAAAIALLGLFALTDLRRRFPGRFGRETAFARQRPAMARAVPLALGLLLAAAFPAAADLAPGGNGAGTPTAGVRYFVQDHLDSTVLVTDEAGNPTASVAYLPQGGIDEAQSTGVDDFRPKFVNKPWDAGSRLYDFGARWYDPSVGRFTTPDPAQEYLSPYLYAGSSPQSYIDPNGDFAFLAAVVVGAVVGAYFGAAAVNHDFNPAHWDWKSGKTYAGLLGGAAIGGVGAAAGGLVVQAGVAIGGAGGLAAQAAGVAVGIAGEALIGAGESAAFTALAGGSGKEIVVAAAQGAVLGAVVGAASQGLTSLAASFSRRARPMAGEMAEALEGQGEGGIRSSRRGCSSFAAGTPVHTGEGALTAIEDVRTGDRLLAFDPHGGRREPREVLEVYTREVKEAVRLTLAGGEALVATPEHRFQVAGKGWVPARHLAAGMELASAGDRPVRVAAVEPFTPDEPLQVYNFLVEGLHDYYVSEDGVLVENGTYCTASIDAKGVVTETWDESALLARFPKQRVQQMKSDIRLKARRANYVVKKYGLKPTTNVGTKKVRTASMPWIKANWKKSFGPVPRSIRVALQKMRPRLGPQDVDEFLTRVQGGLTIAQGLAENQGPLDSFVNQTSGAAMGQLSKGPTRNIRLFRIVFI